MGAQDLIDQFGLTAASVVTSQFPRKCTSCKRPYDTFVNYLKAMEPCGAPHPDPIDDEDGVVGLLCFYNCACGSTLALRYEDVKRHRAFNEAVRRATRLTGQDEGEILTAFVAEVNKLARDFETVSRAPSAAPAAPAATASTSGPLPIAPGEQVDPLQLEVGAAVISDVRRGKLSIPPAPTIAMRVQQMTRDPRAKLDSIAEVIAGDASLSTEVLKVANSLMFSPSNRSGAVTSLPAAIQRIGITELGSIAVAATLGKMTRGNGPLTALRAQLWRQSVVTAVIARSLGQQRKLNADEAFLSGLLSNLGTLLGTLGVEQFLAGNPKFPVRPMAWWRHVVELFTNELGATAATAWKLAPTLTAVVGNVSGTSQAKDPAHRPMVDLIRTAAAIARLAIERPFVSFAKLEKIEGLSPAERTLVAGELPTSAQRVAALCDGGTTGSISMSRKLVGSTGPITEPAPLARSLKVTARSLDGAGYECTALGEAEFMLVGKAAIQEQTLVSLEVQLTPPLALWATVVRSEAKPPLHQITLAPFAMTEDAHKRWVGLATKK